MCGILAHLQSNIAAAPIAHFIVTSDSRFMFSNIYGNSLLSHMNNFIDYTQKNISFQVRTSNDRASNKKVRWLDF